MLLRRPVKCAFTGMVDFRIVRSSVRSEKARYVQGVYIGSGRVERGCGQWWNG